MTTKKTEGLIGTVAMDGTVQTATFAAVLLRGQAIAERINRGEDVFWVTIPFDRKDTVLILHETGWMIQDLRLNRVLVKSAEGEEQSN